MNHDSTYTASLADPDDEERLEQEPESVSRTLTKSGYAASSSTGNHAISPPNTLDEEYDIYQETGFISAAIHQYADDVTMPGVRVSADNEETARWLEEDFLPQSAIEGGQRHQEFEDLLYQNVVDYLALGNILCENVKNGDGDITGFMRVNPAACKADTEPNKPILWSPDAHKKWKDDFTGKKTPRGESAAFHQYHPQSPLGKKGRFDDGRDMIYLSLNDVTYKPRNPPAGEIWGIPITRNIKQEVTEFRNIRRDLARAIRTKAWGIWSVAFDTEVIETKDEVLVDGWSEDEMDEFVNGIGEMGPGEITGHDGSISFEKHEGDVPSEVLEVLESYVKMIVAAFPPPLYAVGFEDNINQFVVKEQEEIYEASVRSMQTTLSQTWNPTLKLVCEHHDMDPSGVELELEPAEDESPVRSMELDDLEKFGLLADGMNDLFGDQAHKAFNKEQFAELVLQLPEDALKEEAFAGVPGGVPGDLGQLPYVEELTDGNGRVTRNQLDALRQELAEGRNVDDPPSSTHINPFLEQGTGEQTLFADDDDDDEQEVKRNPDGTLAGSN